MLDLHRDKFIRLEKAAAAVFAPLPLTPNQYTGLSVFSILFCFFFLAFGNYPAAFFMYAIAAAFDFVDGAVARAKGLAGAKGAYLDTIADRYVDAILLFGFLFVNLPDILMPSYAWIFLILLGSIMTTYAKAAASEKKLSGGELKGGLMSRAERIVLYLAALAALNFSSLLVAYILALLAVLTNITAIQRIGMALDSKIK
jgi:archaetidylinositol phosphate synthase